MKIWIIHSHAGAIVSVLGHEPTKEERTLKYMEYLEGTVKGTVEDVFKYIDLHVMTKCFEVEN